MYTRTLVYCLEISLLGYTDFFESSPDLDIGPDFV